MRKVKKEGQRKLGFLEKISPDTRKFLLFATICLLIKLALTSWRSIYAIPNGLSDDGLMQNTAMSMLEFHWFGGFNAFTLSKRNIFSFYLALVNALGIPLLVANELLYFVAVLIIVFLIKKYTNRKWPLYVAFGLMFFNPATFATATSVRIYRDVIYPSVIMIFLGALFHVYYNIKNQKKYTGWLVLYVASLTVFWYLREESVWILPILIVVTLLIIFFVVKSKGVLKKKRAILGLTISPVLGVVVVGLGFRIINLALYGNFVVTEDQSSSYQDFYKVVGKINSENRTNTIDFPTDVRYKIYEVSPTFATIKDQMENVYFPALKVHGDNPEEINAGWTVWAVRQAMAASGQYKDAKTADKFYERVAKEIETACDEGKFECTNEKPGLTRTILNNFPRVMQETFDNLRFVYKFSGTEVKQQYSEPEPVVLGEVSEILTGENVMMRAINVQEDPGDLSHFTMVDKIKIKILSGIRKIYEVLSPIMFWVAVVLMVGLGIYYLFVRRDGRKFYERPEFDLVLFSLCGLGALVIRCLIVAYLNVTAFYATSDLYLYTGYSLVLMFDALVLVLAARVVHDIIRRKADRDGKK